MKLEGILLLIASGTVVTTATLSTSTVSDAVWRYNHGYSLRGGDVVALRYEALTLLPRGSRLNDATAKLASIGFTCQSAPHGLPNVTAVSLVCDSNGRGAPLSPQVDIAVVCRNGLVADIEVSNIFATTISRRAAGEPDRN